ncbi:MAG: cupin domain-containing protein [Planctomycetota bacterium]|nr:cupin domain-containing protein [Planctomycetota bacterium]
MRRDFLMRLLALLPLSWGAMNLEATRSPTESGSIMHDQPETNRDTKVASFHVDALIEEQARDANAYLNFFDNKTMSLGLYVLRAGSKDGQSPHARDEVYIITHGKAILDVAGTDHPVSPGSVVFVQRKVVHHFHSIEEDLKVIVFFSKHIPDP